jgi:hypothetical protein
MVETVRGRVDTPKATARHAYDSRRDLVTLKLRLAGYVGEVAVPLEAREARRLAWGILADVDPDEVGL